MSNNQSWRHHYLPQFYLDGFTKEAGKIKVYDVQNKRFVKGGELLSTKSFFFEKNGNTVVSKDGTSSDFLEKVYADMDSNVAEFFKRIRAKDSSTKFGMNEYDIQHLNHFVSVMYWRLPQNGSKLNKIVQESSFAELGMKVVDKDGFVSHETQEKLKNDDAFVKAYKAFNPLADAIRGFNCRTPYHIISKHSNFPFIVSDNPVIIEDPASTAIHSDDYIFPISGSRYLIRANSIDKAPTYLPVFIDRLIFKQATRYISCTDERYIDLMEEFFIKNDVDEQQLRSLLFKFLK